MLPGSCLFVTTKIFLSLKKCLYLIKIWRSNMESNSIPMLVIQVRNSKIDFDMEVLSISCRNNYWSQYFNRILFSSTSYLTIWLAIVVQAALDSRTACTTTARPGVIKPVDEIKIWLKHCDQCLFLQPMLSARSIKSIFEFRICIPSRYVLYKTVFNPLRNK